MSMVELSQEEYTNIIDGRERAAAVTPVFRWEKLINVAQSELAKRDVFEEVEVVELRVAGLDSVVNVCRADEKCGMDGFTPITYKIKYADAYSSWIAGDGQQAKGTPLEALFDFGVSPAQVSACKSHKIYTVEALMDLEGANLRTLGMEANALKEACRKYKLDRADKGNLLDELAELKARLAAQEAGPVVKEVAIPAGDPYPGKTDDELKEMIGLKFGQKPRGNPKRETLIQMLEESN